MIIKCPNCKRELDVEEDTVMKLCKCGEIIDLCDFSNLDYVM